ncbi:DUF3953 domain-containing protein [Neobacillus drentensis]|uniref:DUF3953 domain-containing protein n=1 Tax=Neobacillus drentensis TaxID=220684 RepID=UPI002FFD85EC
MQEGILSSITINEYQSRFLQGVRRMLKIIRIILSIIVMVGGIYGLITSNNAMLPYMMGLLGVISFIWGITELHNKQKAKGIFYFITAAFVIFVVIQTTLFR